MRPTRHIPVNKFPRWKNIAILLILVVSVIYAIPNFFGQMPSLQISPKNGHVNKVLVDNVSSILHKEKVKYKKIYIDNHNTNIDINFDNASDQAAAQTVLNKGLGDKLTVAMVSITKTPNWLLSIGAQPMNLGLDLRGGMYLMLNADTQVAIDSRINNYQNKIISGLRAEKIEPLIIKKSSEDKTIATQFIPEVYSLTGYAAFKFKNAKDLDLAAAYIKDDFIAKNNSSVIYKKIGANYLLISINSTAAYKVRQEAISQVVTVMRNRINALGVSEASVAQEGNNRVVIELPGLQDAARAKQILGGTSTASFYLVNRITNRLAAEEKGIRLFPVKNNNITSYYQLKGQPIAAGADIINATPGIDHRSGLPIVQVQLDSNAASHMRKTTIKNTHKLMGVMMVDTSYKKVIVDGKSVSKIIRNKHLANVAAIDGPFGSSFEISGLSQRKASDLALMIRSGALQVPVHIAQEQQIGPTLGQENINKGIVSIIIALILVVLFMTVYYGVFGLIANAALIMNLILILAVMSIIPGATLTLPGIAGIVLNLGMSIDGNVLIFERVREELRGGTPIQSAIYSGYEKAFGTIVDSNLTTLIVAIILFIIGTGAVKGFAVTLMIGIITSMFTAVTVSRAMTNSIYGSHRRNLKKISIGI